MSNKINEKVVDLSGDIEPVTEANSSDSQQSRSNKNGAKKRNKVLSNIILIVAVIGIIAGGGILGTTLWNEYLRSQQTKTYINEAEQLVKDFIPKSEFNPQPGDVVGILIFPSQDNLTVPIIQGTRAEDLHAGAGHDVTTGWPTEQRQVFLSGHRNTEFGALKNIKAGDEVIVKMLYGQFSYRVTGTAIHPETAVDQIKPKEFFEHDQLALMTCYPFTFGADTKDRFFVYAERVE